MAKDKRSKREVILDAAYTLFIEKGYWDTKIIDIADAAGIGKGTIYEYFESKDAIFLELFKTKVAAGYETLPDLLNREINCEHKIKKYIETELENTSRFTFSRNFLMDLMMKSDAFRNQALIESIHKLVAEKFRIMFLIIEEGVKSGEFRNVDPLLATVSVMGAVNFFVSMNFMPFAPCEFLTLENTTAMNGSDFLNLIINGLKP